jgi:hypothetical protein
MVHRDVRPASRSELAAHYEFEFQKFHDATEKLFISVHETRDATVDTHKKKFAPRRSVDAKPSPPPIVPLPSIQYFEAELGTTGGKQEYEEDNKRVFRWGWLQKISSTFVYVDGAFRFFGSDRYLFWDSMNQQP